MLTKHIEQVINYNWKDEISDFERHLFENGEANASPAAMQALEDGGLSSDERDELLVNIALSVEPNEHNHIFVHLVNIQKAFNLS